MVALARCGHATAQGWNGCGCPILAVKKQNCPQCNEPAERFKLRVDHTGPAQFPVPLCIPGSVTNAEVIEVVLDFRQYLEPESRPTGPALLPPKESDQNANAEQEGVGDVDSKVSDAASVREVSVR